MTQDWQSISHLKHELDCEGLGEAVWLKNEDQEALGFFCDLAAAAPDGDAGLPPSAGWYDTYGQPLGFAPVLYRRVDS